MELFGVFRVFLLGAGRELGSLAKFFTMSLIIGLLAVDDPSVQDHIKMGILLGSVTGRFGLRIHIVLWVVFVAWILFVFGYG